MASAGSGREFRWPIFRQMAIFRGCQDRRDASGTTVTRIGTVMQQSQQTVWPRFLLTTPVESPVRRR